MTPDKLNALIKYIEKRDNAEMTCQPEGYIMVKKSRNNCKHKGTNHTGYCDSGCGVTCEHWEWKGI